MGKPKARTKQLSQDPHIAHRMPTKGSEFPLLCLSYTQTKKSTYGGSNGLAAVWHEATCSALTMSLTYPFASMKRVRVPVRREDIGLFPHGIRTVWPTTFDFWTVWAQHVSIKTVQPQTFVKKTVQTQNVCKKDSSDPGSCTHLSPKMPPLSGSWHGYHRALVRGLTRYTWSDL